jgi:hypothetical protein
MPHAKGTSCRIVDVIAIKSGDVEYVDGMRVPGDVTTIDYLRQQEKSSPRTCLLLFVPSSVKIRDIEDFRVIAGKMQYEDFHPYLYEDRYRDLVREILYGSPVNPDELRSGPQGQLAWPDHQRETK